MQCGVGFGSNCPGLSLVVMDSQNPFPLSTALLYNTPQFFSLITLSFFEPSQVSPTLKQLVNIYNL